MLVGNKSDLAEGREVSAEEGERVAAEWGMPYVEASAKTRENVDYVFMTLALRLLAMRDNPPRPSTGFFSKLKHRLRRGGGATTKVWERGSLLWLAWLTLAGRVFDLGVAVDWLSLPTCLPSPISL